MLEMIAYPVKYLPVLMLALATGVPSQISAETTSTTGVANGMQPEIALMQFVEDTGSANRIIAGDFLRTLSQEIPAAVCHIHNGIDVAEATELLTGSIAHFDAVTQALLNGNDAMGIVGGETRRRTVGELEALSDAWKPVHDAALNVLADAADADATAIVYGSADYMLEKTYHLLSELEGEYANPVELLHSDMMLLEVSGRMAAMTQRMAYEACRVWSHEGSDELIADLGKTIGIYEASMNALSNGMPELGIMPPPTPEIAASLEVVADGWTTIRGYLDTVVSGEEVSVAIREDLYHQLAVKLHKVEEIEVLYQTFSKRVY
jgi:hypothetical protein